MRSRIAFALAAVCGVGAVLLAVLPYTGRISFHPGQMVTGGAGIVGSKGFEGDCGPPIISSWHAGAETWTEDTNKTADGYAQMDSLGPWCEDSARARLLSSLGLGVLGIAAVGVGRRMRPDVVSPAPS